MNYEKFLEDKNWLEFIKNGGSITSVQLEARTYEICLEAVKQDGYALCFVPEKLIDRDSGQLGHYY